MTRLFAAFLLSSKWRKKTINLFQCKPHCRPGNFNKSASCQLSLSFFSFSIFLVMLLEEAPSIFILKKATQTIRFRDIIIGKLANLQVLYNHLWLKETLFMVKMYLTHLVSEKRKCTCLFQWISISRKKPRKLIRYFFK